MKRIISVLCISLFFFSCEKKNLIPENEIPDWLKVKIRQDEQLISDHPKAMSAFGAWVRYKWDSEYYFQYSNIVSSSLYVPISLSGDTLFTIYNPNMTYAREKCCMKYVWKGPLYKEF